MNLYIQDYRKEPKNEDIQEYEKILVQETQNALIGRKNLRYLYPQAIRHHQSLFPNNHIELLDYRLLKENGLKPEVNALINEFQSLIHAPDTNERDILRFINHKPAFFIPASILVAGGFTFGHHNLYLFPEFPIGTVGKPTYKADYLLIGSGSGGYEFLFVELEKSNGRITLKDGHFGEAIRKGNFQIHDWIKWIEAHNASFFEVLSTFKGNSPLPTELTEYDSTRFHFVTVAGLRSDYSETTYWEKRKQKKDEDILQLHYDNLFDSANELNYRMTF